MSDTSAGEKFPKCRHGPAADPAGSQQGAPFQRVSALRRRRPDCKESRQADRQARLPSRADQLLRRPTTTRMAKAATRNIQLLLFGSLSDSLRCDIRDCPPKLYCYLLGCCAPAGVAAARPGAIAGRVATSTTMHNACQAACRLRQVRRRSGATHRCASPAAGYRRPATRKSLVFPAPACGGAVPGRRPAAPCARRSRRASLACAASRRVSIGNSS